jgi:antitoxin MazE
MELAIISIGNSKGIRFSKTILEKYHIQDKIELVLEKEYMVLKPKQEPEKKRRQAFKAMPENGDDQFIFDDIDVSRTPLQEANKNVESQLKTVPQKYLFATKNFKFNRDEANNYE